MSEEPDYSSLPLNERVIHKVWKVRLGAYEEVIKSIDRSANEDDPIFRELHGDLVKKIVTDSNVVAQETGISVLQSLLKYGGSNLAIRLRGIAVSSLVEKGLASARAGTKQKSIECLLLFIEADSAEPVVEEMLPYLSNKLPKLVAGTTKALVDIYTQFGAKTVPAKLVLPSLVKLFSHADKNVRAEATNLSIELYKWIGSSFEQIIFPDLKPVQQKDLTAAFEKVKDEKPVQLRLLKSQQDIVDFVEQSGAVPDEDGDIEMNGENNQELDPYDLVDPIDVLSKLPADLNERINSAKWKDRKEVLEEVVKVLNVMKMADAEYSELVRILAKCMKDANIQVVQLAANCVEFLGKGLRANFGRYLTPLLNPMLDRTKEKKASVADALATGLDVLFDCTSFSEILEETIGFMKHKTPQNKIAASNYLTRCLTKITNVPKKAEVELIMETGTKLLSDSQEPVRSASSEVIGTLMKITGERELNPYMEKVEDNRKAKVMEFFEKAEVKAKLVAKVSRPVSLSQGAPQARKPVGRPAPKVGISSSTLSGSRTSLSSNSVLKKSRTSTIIPAKRGASSPSKRLDDGLSKPPVPVAGGIRGGLTGRTLTSSTTQSQLPPKFNMGPTPAEKQELDDLRLEKQAWLKEREKYQWLEQEFGGEKARLMQEISILQSKNEKLMDEHTDGLLLLKSKETQISRLNLDLETGKNRVAELERDLESLRNQNLQRSSTTSDPFASSHSPSFSSTRPLSFNGNGNNNINNSQSASYKKTASDLSSRVSGLSIDNNLQYDQKENRYSNSDYLNSYTSNLNKETLELDTNDDSWRRAAEVTSQLKARIEKMKARSRSTMSNV